MKAVLSNGKIFEVYELIGVTIDLNEDPAEVELFLPTGARVALRVSKEKAEKLRNDLREGNETLHIDGWDKHTYYFPEVVATTEDYP